MGMLAHTTDRCNGDSDIPSTSEAITEALRETKGPCGILAPGAEALTHELANAYAHWPVGFSSRRPIYEMGTRNDGESIDRDKCRFGMRD